MHLFRTFISVDSKIQKITARSVRYTIVIYKQKYDVITDKVFLK